MLSRVYLEKDNKCINNVGKTWTINLKVEKRTEKTPKGLLHKNTGLNLCHLCIHIKSLVSFLVQSIYVVFLLNQAEEIFLSFFCKKKEKKAIRVRIKPTFVWNFETYLQIQT